MDFDSFIDQAWTDHATDAPAVAVRIAEQALPLVTEPGRVLPVGHLAHHVFGEHLGQWAGGLAFLERLAALPLVPADAAGALERYRAALHLSAGTADTRAAMDRSTRLRITAMAAANLALHDAARSAALLEEAVAGAEAAGLADPDPAHRSLGIAGNGIAGTLEDKGAARSATDTALMLRAAQVARRYWALAGTWLETERADYRLAMSHLQAGELPQARQHAQACLETVQAHDNVALEAFFGWEALGRVERAAGNTTGHARAVAQAEAAFARLGDGDTGWCRASLDKLKAPAG
jgi:hypothetical protein